MDKISGFLGGDKKKTEEAKPAEGGSSSGQKDDYLDKGFAAGLKKFGYEGKVSKENSEKATDFARGQFEKTSGKKVPEKFSN